MNLQTAAMPANVRGVHIDAAPYNRSDGFSPGSTIVVKVPGLDSAAALSRNRVPPINHIGRFRDPDQAIVVLDARPDELSRPLILSLLQMLWDRGEPDGYAHRMTRHPLPDTPRHKVLMNVALGDHQVTNFAADVEARTIGARAHVPILDPGRWPGVDVLWHVPPIARYPFAESAVFYWDIGPVRPDPANPGRTIGVPPPPLENVPNRAGEDPHGAPRGAPQAEQLISEFLRPRGGIDDVCGGQACHAGGWTGP